MAQPMTKLYTDTNKFEDGDGPPLVEAFNNVLKDLIRVKAEASGKPWPEFVFAAGDKLITARDLQDVDQRVLASGHRYACSAVISSHERPQAYRPVAGMVAGAEASCFEHPQAHVAPADAQGRELRGQGDNVVEYASNVTGTARYFRSVQDVMQALSHGVPPDTIAVIEDSGGTLTAPILEHFKGVLCAGGTVRSHLGILTREYGIPCLMNARISGIRDGDSIEMEVSVPAKTTEAYQQGIEMSGRVWRLKAATGAAP